MLCDWSQLLFTIARFHSYSMILAIGHVMLRLLEEVSELADESYLFCAVVLQYTCHPEGITYFGE